MNSLVFYSFNRRNLSEQFLFSCTGKSNNNQIHLETLSREGRLFPRCEVRIDNNSLTNRIKSISLSNHCHNGEMKLLRHK